MADIKISQLGAAIAVNDTDVVPIVSGGNTLKATAAQLKEHAIGDTDISDFGDGTPTGAIAALNTELGTTKQALTTTSNSLADVKNGDITSFFKAVNTTCNVYMTSNINFDWNNISQQDATDVAQALYDLFKKVGGSQLIVYEGMCSLVFRKASDGSPFGSFNGIIRIISNDPYTDMLAHNDHARLRVVYEQYGDPITYDFGIWGDKITICAHGKNHVNTTFNVQSISTYNTISTYIG